MRKNMRLGGPKTATKILTQSVEKLSVYSEKIHFGQVIVISSAERKKNGTQKLGDAHDGKTHIGAVL